MQISQNIPALRTHLNMQRADRKLVSAAYRLSSGYRINSAKDDPAGLAIANKLSLQLSGISKATDNASNGVALIQTAEGTLSEIQNMLQRMRELAVQAANDTNTVEDREKMWTEVQELTAEIESASSNTEYNRIKILNGEGSRISESRVRGTTAKDVNYASILYVSEDVQPGKLEYTVEKVGTPAAQEINSIPDDAAEIFNGISADKIVSINGVPIRRGNAKSLEELKVMLSETLGYVGIELKDPTGDGDPRYLTTVNAGSNQQISVTGDAAMLECLGLKSTIVTDPATGESSNKPIKGTDAVLKLDNTDDLALYDANGSKLADLSTGLNYYSNGNQIVVKGVHGEEVKINVMVASSDNGYLPTCGLLDAAGTMAAEAVVVSPLTGEIEYDQLLTDELEMEVEFKDYGPIKIQVGGSYNDNISVYIPQMSAETLGLIEYKGGKRFDLLNYNTVHSASLAIDQTDEAIQMVSHVRSRLGAYQNRLEATVRSLDVANENTTSSKSRIIDTDMAKEMTDYSSQNVMYQAGIAIMAQANQKPMQILSLLN